MLTVEVLINLPSPRFNQAFSYLVPEHLSGQIEFGQRVLVEFNRRLLEAYVIKIEEQMADGGMKPLLEILDTEPVFETQLYQLALWIADYYLSSVPQALNTIIPGSMDKKGPVRIVARFAVGKECRSRWSPYH